MSRQGSLLCTIYVSIWVCYQVFYREPLKTMTKIMRRGKICVIENVMKGIEIMYGVAYESSKISLDLYKV